MRKFFFLVKKKTRSKKFLEKKELFKFFKKLKFSRKTCKNRAITLLSSTYSCIFKNSKFYNHFHYKRRLKLWIYYKSRNRYKRNYRSFSKFKNWHWRSKKKISKKHFWVPKPKKRFSWRLLFGKPQAEVCSLLLFSLFRRVLYSNTKRFNIYQIKNFLVKRLRRIVFTSDLFKKTMKVFISIAFAQFFKRKSRHALYQSITPRYKKSRYFKSNKFYKFFNFLAKKKTNKFFFSNYSQWLTRLLQTSFKVRSFLYKKSMIKFYIKKFYQIKPNYILDKNQTFNFCNFSGLRARLDFALVRLCFFSTLPSARSAILEGFIFVNFGRVQFLDFFLKNKDIIFITKNIEDAYTLENYSFIQNFFFLKVRFKRYFFFKKRIGYFREPFIKALTKVFKKLINFKKFKCDKTYITKNTTIKFFLEILFFKDLNINLLRKGLSPGFLQETLDDSISHNHF